MLTVCTHVTMITLLCPTTVDTLALIHPNKQNIFVIGSPDHRINRELSSYTNYDKTGNLSFGQNIITIIKFITIIAVYIHQCF